MKCSKTKADSFVPNDACHSCLKIEPWFYCMTENAHESVPFRLNINTQRSEKVVV